MPRKKLSIKQLESRLQSLDDFDDPKVQLEQYATPPHIAALLLTTIDSTYDDIEGRVVADLGCGTGRLTHGSLLCGAEMVFAFDIDGEALKIGLMNIGELSDSEGNDPSQAYKSCENFNLIQADVASPRGDSFWEPWHNFFDTVMMNPPFGTKQNHGLDMKFLRRAIDISNGTVYSLHKTSTRDYIQVKSREWAVRAKPVAQIRYNLDNTFKFHKKKSVDIDVDLWRIDCTA